MTNTIINKNVLPRSGISERYKLHRNIVSMSVAVVLMAICAWFYSSFSGVHVVDLGVGRNLSVSGLREHWRQGNVVVMIRHAERCDRSSNPCMGDADGITSNGRDTALAVGAGLQKMGMDHARMIASPKTRTQQTAQLLAGHAVVAEDWINDCDSGFMKAVQAHKVSGENMVLVTHSGCIDQFERKAGVRGGERSSEYTQAFFVKVDGSQPPKILGSLNAGQWANLNSEQFN
ncbi:histidine phosphatase family protein [Pseudomonas syringae pv. aptata]|uniref:lipopolysaccharide core heptose(II)-phosphate phosphatase PmrG n=1 Tax=Pseudomonas syringae TaxID=317 RepID=UPI0003523F1B|nr:histidine phosphatase family protein [Pseudomonas syringae]EPF67141.1 Histidine phosphatase domain protein [Pseudomonas syringae pv. syringae SM]MBI6816200.1 histidine phosphatase family protein [Pseudomonas syringae]MBI6822337.1 histidine phosphatase family protein [Pseudomonas syringae]MCK0544937.1 histidine phosphatase family protein [Pseudomonas syringae pv. aptata]UZS70821.1 histidine phosphatase family protein [Pseudomonas syringae]